MLGFFRLALWCLDTTEKSLSKISCSYKNLSPEGARIVAQESRNNSNHAREQATREGKEALYLALCEKAEILRQERKALEAILVYTSNEKEARKARKQLATISVQIARLDMQIDKIFFDELED